MEKKSRKGERRSTHMWGGVTSPTENTRESGGRGERGVVWGGE
jgi:hypothetical protein